MRVIRTTAAILACSAPAALAAHHGSRPRPPSSHEIRTDVARAERSAHLWATINICNSRRYPDVIGIRGQIPGLPFASRVSMRIGVDYADPAHPGSFKPVSGVAALLSGGVLTDGTWQAGVRLRFKPGTGLLRGRITFQWARSGRPIGRLVKVTTSGHTDARFGDPPKFSAAGCTLP